MARDLLRSHTRADRRNVDGPPTAPVQPSLTDNNRSARSSGLRQQLSEEWSRRSALIRHAEQPEIRFDRGLLSRLYQETECRRQGMCVCQKPMGRNNYACWMARNIVDFMQKHFWSKGRDALRETSKPRQLLEENRVVLALQLEANRSEHAAGRPVAATTMREVFLQVGFANFKTWRMSVCQLYKHESDGNLPGLTRLAVVDLTMEEIADLRRGGTDTSVGAPF